GGVGVVIGNQQRYWPLRAGWKSDQTNIHVGEGASLELLLLTFFELTGTKDKHVVVSSDNNVVVKAWAARRSNCRKLNEILQRIHHLVYSFDCTLEVAETPSRFNKADSVSRGEEPKPGMSRIEPEWSRTRLPRALEELVVFYPYEKEMMQNY
ncbi:hypothetical protein JCM8097_002387, partial [Rhodosporidiobolus ruineniae]